MALRFFWSIYHNCRYMKLYNMKRILCILSSLDAGGAETFLMKIYRSLSNDIYQLDFVVSAENGCYEQEVLDRGGRIYRIPQRTKNLKGAFNGIKTVVKENGYDIVLKLGENSLSAVDMIAAKMGGAKILAVRSCNAPTGLSFKARFIHAFFKPLLNRVTNVKIAPSQLAADFMFGKSAKVTLLNNGVDLNIFRFSSQDREDIRKEFDLADKFVVGHVGRFHEQKNHRHLLEVFREILGARSDAVLLMVGTGAREEQIRSWVCELELQNHVIFAGQRFDIPKLLSAMDVFVFPSLYEGMPNTVIEAQATGLPCVIADTITREANITGLVQYLPLTLPVSDWAKTAIDAALAPRKDTTEDFRAHGYDIQYVARDLLSLFELTETFEDTYDVKKTDQVCCK